jgi:hypothetical protein
MPYYRYTLIDIPNDSSILNINSSILIKIDFILFFIFLLDILLLKYFEKD